MLKIRKRPNTFSRWHKIGTTNPIGQRLVFLIFNVRSNAKGDWFEVFLPERPNRSTAWVKREHVRVVKLAERIEVDLSRYTLKLFRNGWCDGSRWVWVGTCTPHRKASFTSGEGSAAESDRSVRKLRSRPEWILARTERLARRGPGSGPRHRRPRRQGPEGVARVRARVERRHENLRVCRWAHPLSSNGRGRAKRQRRCKGSEAGSKVG